VFRRAGGLAATPRGVGDGWGWHENCIVSRRATHARLADMVSASFNPDGVNEMESNQNEATALAVALDQAAEQIVDSAQVDERAIFALFDTMSNATQAARDKIRDLRIADRDTCLSFLQRWACVRYGLTLTEGQRGSKFDPNPLAAQISARDIVNGEPARLVTDHGMDPHLAVMAVQQAALKTAEKCCESAAKQVRRMLNDLFDEPEKQSIGKAKQDEVARLLKAIAKLESDSLNRLESGIDKIKRERNASK